MVSRKRFEELERKLTKRIDYLESLIEQDKSQVELLCNLFIYDDWTCYPVHLRDVVNQLLDLHGLKIVRQPAQAEQFTLEEKEGEKENSG